MVADSEGAGVLTQRDLQRIGLDLAPEAFHRLVAEVVRALPPADGRGDPARDLTAEEVAALERGGLDLAPATAEDRDEDPFARGAAEYAVLLATALSPAAVAERLGVDPSRVRHRLAARTLYGVKTPHGWRLPRFQFDPDTGRALPGLGRVLAALDPELHPLSVMRWFLTPDPDLEVDGVPASPRDWLRRGGAPEAVAPPANVV